MFKKIKFWFTTQKSLTDLILKLDKDLLDLETQNQALSRQIATDKLYSDDSILQILRAFVLHNNGDATISNDILKLASDHTIQVCKEDQKRGVRFYIDEQVNSTGL